MGNKTQIAFILSLVILTFASPGEAQVSIQQMDRARQSSGGGCSLDPATCQRLVETMAYRLPTAQCRFQGGNVGSAGEAQQFVESLRHFNLEGVSEARAYEDEDVDEPGPASRKASEFGIDLQSDRRYEDIMTVVDATYFSCTDHRFFYRGGGSGNVGYTVRSIIGLTDARSEEGVLLSCEIYTNRMNQNHSCDLSRPDQNDGYNQNHYNNEYGYQQPGRRTRNLPSSAGPNTGYGRRSPDSYRSPYEDTREQFDRHRLRNYDTNQVRRALTNPVPYAIEQGIRLFDASRDSKSPFEERDEE